MFWIATGGLILGTLITYDLTQRKETILHNFPVFGHLRFILEELGPELRQYIVASNDEERPFTRDQRRWVYTSAERENNYFGFGSDNDFDDPSNYLVIRHAAFPHAPTAAKGPLNALPCAKILGGWRKREKAFRPKSVINISAMSFGSLSGVAVESLNIGARLADCLHNTGEGGISTYHNRGGGLIWQLGTGYFGARNTDGTFNMDIFLKNVERHNVKAIEIKLSQGAKPGKGGVLPGKKVTAEIAAIRGVPVGEDVLSPSRHSAFFDVPSLVDFIEEIAEKTGLPVGIKSAVGELDFWRQLASHMKTKERGPDYLQIDGGEGGTGAAPLVFSDHVSLPFQFAFREVYAIFKAHELTDHVVFIGSGRLGFPEKALAAMAMGCDMVSVAREAMLSIGCIQAQKCQSGYCPTGVATQSRWLAAGLDPALKSVRFANYIAALRHDLIDLANACGVAHPALVRTEQLDIINQQTRTSFQEAIGYQPGWGLPSEEAQEALIALMSHTPAAH